MSKRKLLLADDSMTIQKVVNLTFADEGIEVFTVGNGTAAVDKLTEIEPDLVLADVHMPGLTGYEVCERIRQNPQYKDIPVMLLVGSFEPFDESEMRRVGANDFLTKPFQSIRQLVQKVTTLLDASNPNAVVSNEIPVEAESVPDFESTIPQMSTPTQALDEPVLRTGESPIGFGDTGMDDEMIETSPGNNFGTGYEDFNATMPATAEREEDELRRTAPLSYADIRELGEKMNAPAETEAQDWQQFEIETGEKPEVSYGFEKMPADEGEPAVYEIDSSVYETPAEQTADFETGYGDTSYPQEETAAPSQQFMTETTPQSESSVLELDEVSPIHIDDLDDDAILDLQTDELQFEAPYPDELRAAEHQEPLPVMTQPGQTVEYDVLPPSQPDVTPHSFDEQANTALAHIGNQAVAQMNLQFPPEVIEAIAQRVVEKLSDKVIEKIAWEIVPDRFDLIVRKHMENRDR